ncbi:MFS transporter [Algibacter amylolyticus]|uniref:MFS transporter n=1 Tax=Algibacter amylolyticus TaxID=1608400 RepID=A0A5M7BIF1_9FLAO|nr:MFS transporter [Algibacter amylolyticus]KAA5827474.1 MFS transporter [Algibacter amylolyticus]MBB5266671.1 integral membrane sensor domain MASE1 [Algibacter amylolyticus]TSJ81719.1 MFS transporter [Algibacter amylolyticus]
MQEKLKVIKMIHIALCAGLIMAYIFIGDLASINLNMPEISQSNILFVLIPVIAYVFSNFMYKTQLKNANNKQKLEDNMAVYQTASIIRWAILEGSAFIILVMSKDFILFGILIILYLALLHPTEDRIKSDLKYRA